MKRSVTDDPVVPGGTFQHFAEVLPKLLPAIDAACLIGPIRPSTHRKSALDG